MTDVKPATGRIWENREGLRIDVDLLNGGKGERAIEVYLADTVVSCAGKRRFIVSKVGQIARAAIGGAADK